jgi:predicted kinase
MPTAYLLCGLPASGKTTWAKQLEKEGAVRLTLDERMLAKYDLTIFDEEYGHRAAEEKEQIWHEARKYLELGLDVVLDWSLWSQDARAEWVAKISAAGHDYKLYYLNTSLDVLRQRLASRNAQDSRTTHVIPLEEFDRFAPIFEPPSAAEGVDFEEVRGPS